MNKIVFSIICICFSFVINAQELTEVDSLKNKIDEEKLNYFVKSMCSSLLTLRASLATKAGTLMELKILNFLGTSKEDKDHKKILTEFWNNNSEKFICTENFEISTRARTPEHFMKRIISYGMHKQIFYKFLLSDPEGYAINVNTIEIYEGKEETVIDYIDSLLNDPDRAAQFNVKEIKNVRSWLIKGYGAKRASELKK